MEEQAERDRIADEAIGQKREAMPPDDVKQRETMSPEDFARRNAAAPGAQAPVPEKTAASLGERVGDAYSDPGSVRQPGSGRSARLNTGSQGRVADRVPSAAREVARGMSDQFSDQRFVRIIAAFGLGFISAVLLERSR